MDDVAVVAAQIELEDQGFPGLHGNESRIHSSNGADQTAFAAIPGRRSRDAAGARREIRPHEFDPAMSSLDREPRPPAGVMIDALRCMTTNAAWLSFDENRLGSLQPGKLADLVVLDRDYLTCPEEQIRLIKPTTTIVGGNIVYQN